MKMINPAKTCFAFAAAAWIAAWSVGCAQAQTNFQRLVNFFYGVQATNFYFGIQGTNIVSYPRGELIEGSDGYLYGAVELSAIPYAYGYSQVMKGSVYRVAKDGSQFTVLHNFPSGNRGVYPISGLLEASDGNLYGVTKCSSYWDDLDGVIYSLGKDGSNFRVLYAFGNPQTNDTFEFPNGPLVEGDDGALYGSTRTSFIFKINKDGNGFQHVHVVQSMTSGLLLASDRRFYGCDGSLFVMNQDGTGFSYLYTPPTNNPGQVVTSRPFEASDGVLYGTSYGGGTSNLGTIFSIHTDGGGFQILHNFTGPDGACPIGGLIEGHDGSLYGTANKIGTNSCGVIFKINKDGSGFQALRYLNGADAAFPEGALLLASDGAFYGSSGADFNSGYVYAYGPNGNGSTLFKLFSTQPIISFSGIQAGTNGVTLNLSGGAAGQNLNIQATADPSNTNGWQVIGSATAAVDGTFQFTDTNAPSFSARFYRGAAQ